MPDLIPQIRGAVIGDLQLFDTPFGRKPLVYADYTASGRSLSFIEDAIREQVLPWYANTHTETSHTGAVTTGLREQARAEIRKAVGVGDDHCVIFCGSGATAAINKLVDILNLRLPSDLDARYGFLASIPAQERPVVFIGPYEHHSNELPWRESIADVVAIPLDANGDIDQQALEQALIDYRDRPLKIGSFSAASNVTGVLSDAEAINALLQQHNALSLWDYAAAAPYVAIAAGNKDAVFISPHKFVGGPGTPGVLVMRKSLMNNRVPAVPGGGTVLFVTPEDHRYLDDHERREEGGTPAIVESIRAGLVFKLQQEVGIERIQALEHSFTTRAIERWSRHPNIQILGNSETPRLSIMSLRLKHHGRDLHYGFVVAVLNDLFGIQARGGCSCAGPYGHSLLGMDMTYSRALEKQILAGYMILRPGWVRLNFNYFIDEFTFEYILNALELVAAHGHRLLPHYAFDAQRGTWCFQGRRTAAISSIFDAEFSNSPRPNDNCQQAQPQQLINYLASAKSLLTGALNAFESFTMHLPEQAEALRWFALPGDKQ